MILTAEQRIQLAMGQQFFQLAILSFENEQLKAQLAEKADAQAPAKEPELAPSQD